MKPRAARAPVKRHPGLKLRRLRKARGLTQSDVANLLGCVQARVSELERGYYPSLEMAVDVEQLTRRWGNPIAPREWVAAQRLLEAAA